MFLGTRRCLFIVLHYSLYVKLFLHVKTRRSLIALQKRFEMALSVSVNLISLVTYCVGLRGEEPQSALPTSFTWTSWHVDGTYPTKLVAHGTIILI